MAAIIATTTKGCTAILRFTDLLFLFTKKLFTQELFSDFKMLRRDHSIAEDEFFC